MRSSRCLTDKQYKEILISLTILGAFIGGNILWMMAGWIMAILDYLSMAPGGIGAFLILYGALTMGCLLGGAWAKWWLNRKVRGHFAWRILFVLFLLGMEYFLIPGWFALALDPQHSGDPFNTTYFAIGLMNIVATLMWSGILLSPKWDCKKDPEIKADSESGKTERSDVADSYSPNHYPQKEENNIITEEQK